MAQGITSSLNLTLSRLNSIESNFSALSELADALNSNVSNNIQPEKPIESDFQTILESKLKGNAISNKIETDVINSDSEIQTSAIPFDEFKEAESINSENKSENKIEKNFKANLKSKMGIKPETLKTVNVDEIIDTVSDKYGVDSDFIKALIKQESGFNPKATSKKGAMGLMQLMPKTAESLGVVDAYNPYQNVEGGIKYLKGLIDRFDGDKKLALAAYNAGPNAVKRYGGIPPYKETQNYVKNIMSIYDKLQNTREVEL